MSFQLTTGQLNALEMVKALRKKPHERPHVGVLRGVAGTGKTTMLRVLAQEIGDMQIVAPTGKAALRVTEATGLGASTIHRWIYTPVRDPLSGNVKFVRKSGDSETAPACPSSKLVVVEEASMVGAEIWNDIYDVAREIGCHILCVGDPFQLPPVEVSKPTDAEPFGLLLPNFRFDLEANLTEITRQALESPIIRASMMVRNGDVGEAIMELPRIKAGDLTTKQIELLDSNGVVLVHRNSTRHVLNNRVREAKKMPDNTLADGEPLLVLKNQYGLMRFNGEVLRFDGWKKAPGKQWDIWDNWKNIEERANFGLASVEGDECAIVPKAVFGKLDNISVQAIDQVAKTAVGSRVPYLHCNFGYTLTTHKSQGSEWNKVLVVIERSVQPYTKDGRRWIYTAVTRAKEEVSILWLAGQKDEQLS